MNNDALQLLATRIDEEVEKSSEVLSNGGAQDYGDYKWRCGIIRGYRLAKGLILDIVERNGEDD